jgi:hypothetical protein
MMPEIVEAGPYLIGFAVLAETIVNSTITNLFMNGLFVAVEIVDR